MKTLNGFLVVLSLASLTACQPVTPSFNLTTEENGFQQGGQVIVQRKVDVLWVIDNSASMLAFQQNLAANFQSFIQDFIQKDYDFHLAVTTTDAYLAGAKFKNNSSLSLLKDGNASSGPTGFPIIDSDTPDVIGTFTKNALQGTMGSGDERAFSSFRAALSNPGNSNFLRPGSFLAVIILSDEDDFSDPNRAEGVAMTPLSTLDTVDSYVSYLDQLTNSTSTNRNYNVSAVTIIDDKCLKAHQVDTTAAIMGKRAMDLVQKTNGVLGDICSANYSEVLKNIQKKILELSTEFVLARRPQVDTISITVDGYLLDNDLQNGWTYNPTKNSIQFHGTGVPAYGSSVQIKYVPADAL